MGSLNQSQMAFGKRLVERMSSIIIDQECIDCLIELVGYKVKQKLTLKQRRLLSKQQKKNKASGKKTSRRGKNNEISDDDDEDDDYEEEEDDENEENESLNADEDEEEFLEDEVDPEANNDSKNSSQSASSNDRVLLRHIDDDGEKGLKLLNMIFMIHNTYNFNTPATYQKLFAFVNSRKDNISSYTLKLLGTYYTASGRSESTKNKEQAEAFNSTNDAHLDKLRHFCKHGKPKQAKHAVHLIHKNFEKAKSEQILLDLYKVSTFLK
jgi:hypothetical protein